MEGVPQPAQGDTAEGPHKKTRIKDAAAAEEVGYAEKPFRDALADLGEAFGAEVQQALGAIAHYRGEEALDGYMKKNSGDKKRAKEILQKKLMAKIGERAFPDKDGYGSPKNAGDFFTEAVESVFSDELEQIMNRHPTEIQSAMTSLMVSIVHGATEMIKYSSRGEALLDVHRRTAGLKPEQQAPSEYEKIMLLSALLHDFLNGKQERAMEIIGFLRKFEKAGEKKIMTRVLPVIERWRTGTRKIDIGTRDEALVDEKMIGFGYVYDSDTKKYLELHE